MANVKAFNAYQEEVKAILAGRQTQFRRVMKFPQWALDYKSEEELAYLLNTKGNVGLSRDGRTYRWFSSGYGFVGDYLYAREAFWARHSVDGGGEYQFCDFGPSLDLGADFHPGVQYCATPECLNYPVLIGSETIAKPDHIEPGDWWLAPPDDWDGEVDYHGLGEWNFLVWPDSYSKLSSARMPRWASRIMLKIKSIKVDRINNIQAYDVIAEGILPASLFGYDCDTEIDKWHEYIDRWNSRNKENTWSSNPWTTVVEFEVVKSKNGVVVS
jgi:hypothetical protein